jgi:hypothetical protein
VGSCRDVSLFVKKIFCSFLGLTLVFWSMTTVFADGAAPPSKSECKPACRGSFVCREGFCKSPCQPLCSSDEICSASGKCIPKSSNAVSQEDIEPTPVPDVEQDEEAALMMTLVEGEKTRRAKKKKKTGRRQSTRLSDHSLAGCTRLDGRLRRGSETTNPHVSNQSFSQFRTRQH